MCLDVSFVNTECSDFHPTKVEGLIVVKDEEYNAEFIQKLEKEFPNHEIIKLSGLKDKNIIASSVPIKDKTEKLVLEDFGHGFDELLPNPDYTISKKYLKQRDRNTDFKSQIATLRKGKKKARSPAG